MIESYLRANKMFVDYSEVKICLSLILFLSYLTFVYNMVSE